MSISYVKQTILWTARKGLSTSLALQCYARLVGSGFLCKMITGDKGKLYSFFYSFIYSRPTQEDCVLPEVTLILTPATVRKKQWLLRIWVSHKFLCFFLSDHLTLLSIHCNGKSFTNRKDTFSVAIIAVLLNSQSVILSIATKLQ